jgi:hypothetical protein
MFRVNLNEGNLLAHVIPGGLLLFSVGIMSWPTIQPYMLLIAAAAGDLQSGSRMDTAVLLTVLMAVTLLALYVLSMFFGAMLAVAMGYLEFRLLDPWAARRLEISEEVYAAEWCRYIDHIEDKRNPYISRVVDSLVFEFRTGLAGVVLCGVLLAFSQVPGKYVVLCFLASMLMLWAARDDHYNLAEFRHRRFSSSAAFSADVEDCLSKLVGRWCDRQELRPLGLLADIWPLNSESRVEASEMSRALDEIEALGPAVIYPMEADLISRARASLTQREVGKQSA